ncbi:MAG TPA: hypothetical protein VG186_03760 [Solirubrobacteraceae bacterium]|nr:hypothetical protein [Solirubrobacteraceae bacterium]
MATACVLTAAVAPAKAVASSTQQSLFQDDNELVYASATRADAVLAQLASLGVERIRVSVIWALVAPNPTSTTRPSFDATNPAAYPAGAWDRYDTLVTDAQALGLKVDFDVTSPAPYWATARPPASVNGKFNKNYLPSAVQFGQFVRAVGTRYSGSYVIPTPPAPPTPTPTLFGLPLPPALTGATTTPAPPAPAPLPRVDYWEIWNEPNEAGWLTPQWRRGPALPAVHHHKARINWIEASPVVYRGLLDSAWNALAATGHSGDTILVGDTSAKGSTSHGTLPAIPPLTFLRALYCVSGSYHPLTGTRAAALSCPRRGQPGAFGAAHPALLQATGYADHPYSFTLAPNIVSTDPTWATLADLPRLERALQRIYAAYSVPAPSGVPLYLTEYGYKSNPPNPFVKISEAQQAAYINQGEYMAWSDPYVRALAQFELVDSAPQGGEPVGSPAYWGTFQTGLITLSGVPKPSYFAYRIPIWLPKARAGPRVTVWGQLRPANHAAVQTAIIEYRAAGSSAFTPIRSVQTASPQGFLVAHLPLSTPGLLRIAWIDPDTGNVFHSRIVAVR